ncbi:MAG: NfeD family protein [Muribaculum sp.]
MEGWIIWLGMAALLLIVEVLTQTMWSLCLAAGCIASMTAALCGVGTEWQLALLVVCSFIAYLVLIPLFRRRHGHTKSGDSRTGMDALLGRRAIVTHEIKPGECGRARIDGDNWQVRAPGADGVIVRGSEVTVTGYDSIILDVAAVSDGL